VREIRRKTRRKFAPEEKVRIVLEGLRGEQSISELCRRLLGRPRADLASLLGFRCFDSLEGLCDLQVELWNVRVLSSQSAWMLRFPAGQTETTCTGSGGYAAVAMAQALAR
jgi:hypothetical protein